MDAAERVRMHLDEWIKEHGHGAKLALARHVSGLFGEHKSQSWVTGLVSKRGKRQDLRLRDLDAVADVLGKPPGELVAKFGTIYRELTMSESRLIDYLRALPPKWLRPSRTQR
jgi:hypothetical protein